jgi:uncharacterized membrane protein
MDAAVITFDHIEGAERAYSDERDRRTGAPWLDRIAFLEAHHRGRIVVRGTILGHYVDIEDEGDLIGRDTVIGAGLGVLVGLALGPPGWAAGLVLGGTAGGLEEAVSHIPTLKGPAFDEIRKDVPENSSALVLVDESSEVDAMLAALGKRSKRVTRYHLSPEAIADLEEAVASFPAAAR